MSDETEFETRIAYARTLYEGTHGMTMAELAVMTGLPKRTLMIHARDGEWRKLLETKSGGSTEAAKEAAKFFAGERAERAGETAAAEETSNENSDLLTAPRPTDNDALLARHQKEWDVPRTLSAQAMRMANTDPMKAFERAKLAKITSENLTLVHNGERKAYGIDKAGSAHTVVIEREAPDND